MHAFPSVLSGGEKQRAAIARAVIAKPELLLAGTDHAVADACGVWGERSYAGKKSMGVKRSTFVIDAEGNVARAMYGVSPDGHADQVLEALPVGS